MTDASLLTVRDSSRFGALDDDDRAWLRELQHHLRTDDHVIRLGSAAEDPEPIVYSDAEGNWRAGRYVGALQYAGRRLEIAPRFEFEVLLRWLDSARASCHGYSRCCGRDGWTWRAATACRRCVSRPSTSARWCEAGSTCAVRSACGRRAR
jgi:hypothetical protein